MSIGVRVRVPGHHLGAVECIHQSPRRKGAAGRVWRSERVWSCRRPELYKHRFKSPYRSSLVVEVASVLALVVIESCRTDSRVEN